MFKCVLASLILLVFLVSPIQALSPSSHLVRPSLQTAFSSAVDVASGAYEMVREVEAYRHRLRRETPFLGVYYSVRAAAFLWRSGLSWSKALMQSGYFLGDKVKAHLLSAEQKLKQEQLAIERRLDSIAHHLQRMEQEGQIGQEGYALLQAKQKMLQLRLASVLDAQEEYEVRRYVLDILELALGLQTGIGSYVSYRGEEWFMAALARLADKATKQLSGNDEKARRYAQLTFAVALGLRDACYVAVDWHQFYQQRDEIVQLSREIDQGLKPLEASSGALATPEQLMVYERELASQWRELASKWLELKALDDAFKQRFGFSAMAYLDGDGQPSYWATMLSPRDGWRAWWDWSVSRIGQGWSRIRPWTIRAACFGVAVISPARFRAQPLFSGVAFGASLGAGEEMASSDDVRLMEGQFLDRGVSLLWSSDGTGQGLLRVPISSETHDLYRVAVPGVDRPVYVMGERHGVEGERLIARLRRELEQGRMSGVTLLLEGEHFSLERRAVNGLETSVTDAFLSFVSVAQALWGNNPEELAKGFRELSYAAPVVDQYLKHVPNLATIQDWPSHRQIGFLRALELQIGSIFEDHPAVSEEDWRHFHQMAGFLYDNYDDLRNEEVEVFREFDERVMALDALRTRQAIVNVQDFDRRYPSDEPLLLIGGMSHVLPVLEMEDDPDMRTYLLEEGLARRYEQDALPNERRFVVSDLVSFPDYLDDRHLNSIASKHRDLVRELLSDGYERNFFDYLALERNVGSLTAERYRRFLVQNSYLADLMDTVVLTDRFAQIRSAQELPNFPGSEDEAEEVYDRLRATYDISFSRWGVGVASLAGGGPYVEIPVFQQSSSEHAHKVFLKPGVLQEALALPVALAEQRLPWDEVRLRTHVQGQLQGITPFEGRVPALDKRPFLFEGNVLVVGDCRYELVFHVDREAQTVFTNYGDHYAIANLNYSKQRIEVTVTEPLLQLMELISLPLVVANQKGLDLISLLILAELMEAISPEQGAAAHQVSADLLEICYGFLKLANEIIFMSGEAKAALEDGVISVLEQLQRGFAEAGLDRAAMLHVVDDSVGSGDKSQLLAEAFRTLAYA